MSAVNVHLVLNHASIMAAIFSVLVFAFGFVRKNATLITTASVGFVVAALLVIPVFLTGEPSEEAVEHLPGIVESVIEQHEEAAERALWLIEICGALALGTLVFRTSKFFSGKVFYPVLLLVSVVSAGSIGYAGYLGGKIRHTETSSPASANVQGENGQQNEPGEGEDDDD